MWLAFVATCGLLILLAKLGNQRRQLSPAQPTPDNGDVGCGKCGYNIRGLPGDICPECGSDLNEVGRYTARFRRWQNAPPVLRLFGWTVGCLVVLGMNVGAHQQGFAQECTVRAKGTEWFFMPADREPERTYLLRQETKFSELRRSGFSNRGFLAERFSSKVAVYRVAPDRLATLTRLAGSGNFDWPPPRSEPLFEFEGTPEQVDEIDWSEVVSSRLGEDGEETLTWQLSYTAASLEKSYEIYEQSTRLQLDWAAWLTDDVTFLDVDEDRYVWPPVAVMGGIALLTWLLGIPAVVRKRPINTTNASEAD